MQVTFNHSVQKTNFNGCGDWSEERAVQLMMSRDPGDCYFPSCDDSSSSYDEPTWSKNLLKITTRSPEEMYDLAEYFHKFSNWELLGVCAQAYMLVPWRIRGAHKKLVAAVNEVKEHREELEKAEEYRHSEGTNAELEMVKRGEKIVDEKFTNKILSNLPPANGFLVYGNSEKKESVRTHLYVDVKYDVAPTSLHLKQIKADMDIKKTFKELKSFAENILVQRRTTDNLHGVFFIHDFDFMLQQYRNSELKDIQNQFLEFMKTCAEKYHTTVIGICNAKTNEEIKNYRNANLFVPIQISYHKRELSSQEREQVKAELKRLDEKASQAYLRFKE